VLGYRGDGAAMDGSLVYRKSGRGAARLAGPHGGGLTARERNVLILLDGQRTISELSELFDRDALPQLIRELEGKGLAKRVDCALDAELAGAITQFRAPSTRAAPLKAAEPKAPEPRPDGHPLFWSVVILALTIWSGYWLTDRYENQARSSWQFSPLPPVDWSGVQAVTDPTGANRAANVEPVTVAPISRLPATQAAAPARARAP
jgi:hypothetical protein